MKKLIAIASMLFLLPLSAFGLTMMDDSQMNDVTAQAGVTIGIDMNMTMAVDTAGWGDDGIMVDTDGDGVVDAQSDGGWVGISDMDTDLFIGLRKDYTTAADYSVAEFLTIDVASGTALYDGATFVRIGLGTLEISGNMSFDFALGDGSTANANGIMTLEETLGSVLMQGFEVRLGAGGYVDITADNRTGVTLGLNVQIDEINMALGAWGDDDGIAHLGATTAAATIGGYVGLAGLDIDNVAITGELGIDVLTVPNLQATTALSELTDETLFTNAENAVGKLASVVLNTATWVDPVSGAPSSDPTAITAPGSSQMSGSMVMLTLGNADGTVDASDLNITMDTMSGAVVVGAILPDGSLHATGQLGNIYVGGVDVQIDGLVAIGAH